MSVEPETVQHHAHSYDEEQHEACHEGKILCKVGYQLASIESAVRALH
jgi:hypothetical protein